VNLKIIGITVLGFVLLASAWGVLHYNQRPDSRDEQMLQLAQRVSELEYRLQQLEENSKQR
jgi:hypothetical protein